MCGIGGLIEPGGPSRGDLMRMAAVMSHRGPDDEGVEILGECGLAHTRLAVVDLTRDAHQPMCNEDGTVWIVYNGEVYNHRELAASLESSGHVFRSRSDTEVVLHSYEEWGDECVDRFNGMWAFAVWDRRRRRLFCSRDRFGIKPFYYSHTNESFVFGSEIKVILAAGLDAAVNMAYAAHVIVDGVLDDGPDTFFKGVSQLMPGHNLVWEHGEISTSPYWTFNLERVRDSYDYRDPAGTLRDLLTDSVRLRVVSSDVTVGACLSGGIDSSSIVALARGLYEQPMETFTVAYNEDGFDESRYAKLVSAGFSTKEHVCRPDGADYFDYLSRSTWHQDEPTLGPGTYSQWHVMSLAHSRVKVLLDGQGGDETMAGYHPHLEAYLRTLISRGWLRRFARELPIVARTVGNTSARLATRIAIPVGLRERIARMRGVGTSSDISPELTDEAARHPVERTRPPTLSDPLSRRLVADLTRDVLPGLLHYEDRNSMAFSIEARTPFLDYRLVEYALGIPSVVKVQEGQTKWLFREAMRGILPAAVLERRDKMGYSTPVRDWYAGRLAPTVREFLSESQAGSRGIFNAEVIGRKLDEHVAGRADYSWQIHRWLTVEQWFRTFIDRRDPALGPVRKIR